MSHGHRKAILPTIALSLMTVISAVAGLMVSLPYIARDTGASQTQLTWIVDAYTVVFAGLLLIAGAIADRYGRRRVLLFGLGIYIVTNFVGLFISDASGLIALRSVAGIGAAFIMPSTLSVITTVYTGEERAKAISVWVGVAGGGAVIGLFGTAFLLRYYDWHSFFALNLGLAIIAAIGTIVAIPESREMHSPKLDFVGGLLSVVAVSGLVFGIIEGPERGWTSVLSLSGLVVGTLAGIAFVLWELRQQYPLLDPRLFRNRAFTAGSSSILLQFLCQFGFIFVGMQYLQYVVGYSAWDAVIRLLPMPLIILPASRIAGRLATTMPQKKMGAIGMSLFGLGLFDFAAMDSNFNILHFWSGLALFGAGFALASVPATTAITSSLPKNKQGVASAVNDVSREFGSAVGIAILGSALNGKYRGEIDLNLSQVPSQILERIKSSVAFTQMNPQDIIEKFPQAAPLLTQWDSIVATAKYAFTDGMRLSLIIAGSIALFGGLWVAVVAPNEVAKPLED